MKKITPNLMVECMADACAFYQDVLGFRIIMSVPQEGECQWVLLQRGPVDIMLQVRDSLESEYPQLKNRTLGSSATLYIRCDDIVHVYTIVQQKNPLCIIKPLHTTWYDAQEFAIQDVSGYILVFAQH